LAFAHSLTDCKDEKSADNGNWLPTKDTDVQDKQQMGFVGRKLRQGQSFVSSMTPMPGLLNSSHANH
jgi:hypothetical protein